MPAVLCLALALAIRELGVAEATSPLLWAAVALVADLAPAERRGTAFGWFNLTAGVMLLPASLVFGWLWQAVSSWAAFGFSGACALAAGVLLRVWVFHDGRGQFGT